MNPDWHKLAKSGLSAEYLIFARKRTPTGLVAFTEVRSFSSPFENTSGPTPRTRQIRLQLFLSRTYPRVLTSRLDVRTILLYHKSYKDHNSGPYNETKSQNQPARRRPPVTRGPRFAQAGPRHPRRAPAAAHSRGRCCGTGFDQQDNLAEGGEGQSWRSCRNVYLCPFCSGIGR
jgi:hypothetical protein